MPLGRRIARLNKRGLNKLMVRLAPWAPGFGVLHHTGRRSGAHYSIPINVFRRGNGYLIALTYGPESDWVRNVLAAGGTRLTTRRREYTLSGPQLLHSTEPQDLPLPVRTILRLTRTYDYLRVTAEAG